MKTDTIYQLAGYILGSLLIPWIFYWYNYVLYWQQLAYWQWFIIGLGWMLVTTIVKRARHLTTPVLVVCILLQCAAWAGVVTLPFFKP